MNFPMWAVEMLGMPGWSTHGIVCRMQGKDIINTPTSQTVHYRELEKFC